MPFSLERLLAPPACENNPWIHERFGEFCYSIMTGRKRVLYITVWHSMKEKGLETPQGNAQADMWQLGASVKVLLFSHGGFL